MTLHTTDGTCGLRFGKINKPHNCPKCEELQEIETLRDALKALVFAATSPALSAEDRGFLSQSVNTARAALKRVSR